MRGNEALDINDGPETNLSKVEKKSQPEDVDKMFERAKEEARSPLEYALWRFIKFQ